DEFLADLVATCPEAADDRDDWLPADILAETRQRPLPEAMAAPRLPAPVPPHVVSPAPAGRPPRPRNWENRRIWAAGAVTAVIVTAIGLFSVPFSVPSGNSLVQAAPSAAVPAAAGVGFNWTGITNFKETFSSDDNFKQAGSTWGEQWSFHTDCGPQSCDV